MSFKGVLCFVVCLTLTVQLQARPKDEAVLAKITPDAISARIAEHRMGDLVIKTKSGAKVSIKQTRHEFLFGTAVPNHLAEMSEDPMTPEERTKYLRILTSNFNYAVHENAIKWYDTEKEQGVVDYSVPDRILEILTALNVPMRGHCVYWAKDEFLVDWLKDLDNNELRSAIGSRAKSLISHYKGKINEFDLNNEMLHGDFFRSRLGYGVINEMAWMVKAHNPDAKIYTNDYGIVDVGYNAGPYANQIEKLLANGVPIDGIGMQAHRSIGGKVDNSLYMVQRNIDRFKKFNLPIKITEALFVYDTDEERAAELKKLFPLYFSQANIEGILMWGFWEKAHWVPESAMWKTDFSPTKQSQAYRDLVFGEWWTDTEKTADDKGKVQMRAFYGDYDITVNGTTKKVQVKKGGGKTVVRF